MQTNSLSLIPRISEKTFAKATDENVYTFNVRGEASKPQIKEFVTDRFKVTVTNVRVLNRKGKTVASYRKGQRPINGTRKTQKIAYVTLKKGDSIKVFEEVS